MGSCYPGEGPLESQSTPSTPPPTQKPMPAQSHPAERTPAEHDAAAVGTGLFRASKLLGKDVFDAGHVKVGSLKDVAVEESGELIAIVKRADGELAGLPMAALVAQCKVKTDGKAPKADDKVKVEGFLLTASAEKLASAPLINEVGNIDRLWMERVRERFAASGDDQGRDAPVDDPTTADATPAGPVCVDKLIGMKVKGAAGADVGELEELVVSLPDGKLAYAVVSTGGMLGMGSTPRGFAWNALTLDSTGKHFEVAADKAAIEKMPSVDFDHLTARPDLQASVTSPAGMGPVAQEPTR